MSRALTCLLLVLATGCTSGTTGSAPDPSSTLTPSSTPRVGGATTRAPHPGRPMSRMERYIAGKLASKVVDEGLDLEYLDCPTWGRRMPHTINCEGFFNGVVGEVEVRLDATAGGLVAYDAKLTNGVISTRKLVERLEADGYRQVNCGDAPAYPADVGSEVVCSVDKVGDRVFVVARVSDLSGGVLIREY